MAYRHVLKERLAIKGNARYAKTFGNKLRDAGYKTAIVGKWQLSERDFQAPFHFGFEEYLLWHFGMRVNGVQTPGSQGSRYWDPVFYHNGKLLSETKGQFGPDVMADFVEDYIQSIKRSRSSNTRRRSQPPHRCGPWCATRGQDFGSRDSV